MTIGNDRGIHVVLRVFRIPPEQNQTVCSPENSPLCGNPNTAGAALPGKPLLQKAVELRRRSIILSRCPLEPPLAEMAFHRGAPAVFYYTLEQIAQREILLLEEIQC
jgi:hypothetical protein